MAHLTGRGDEQVVAEKMREGQALLEEHGRSVLSSHESIWQEAK
jgi:hypothetical protein